MLPILEIKEGDLFANPLFKNASPPGVIFRVEKINEIEKTIRVQAYSGSSMMPISTPFWKHNKDRMFSEAWRY